MMDLIRKFVPDLPPQVMVMLGLMIAIILALIIKNIKASKDKTKYFKASLYHEGEAHAHGKNFDRLADQTGEALKTLAKTNAAARDEMGNPISKPKPDIVIPTSKKVD